MNRDKPEIGDVWEDCETKMYVSAVAKTENLDCFYALYLNGNGEIIGNWIQSSLLTFPSMKYLGKSKVNLEELFDVKED